MRVLHSVIGTKGAPRVNIGAGEGKGARRGDGPILCNRLPPPSPQAASVDKRLQHAPDTLRQLHCHILRRRHREGSRRLVEPACKKYLFIYPLLLKQ